MTHSFSSVPTNSDIEYTLKWLCLTHITCYKICQLPAQYWWFSPGTLASSNIKTDCHDMTEIIVLSGVYPQSNK